MGNLNEFDINKELSKLSIWLKLNKVSLNVGKSKFMIFHHPRKKNTIPCLEINNTELECVNRLNFLGLEINTKLTWKAHVDKISNKIVKTLGIMNKLKYVFPQSALVLLYYLFNTPTYKLLHTSLGNKYKKSIQVTKTCSQDNYKK